MEGECLFVSCLHYPFYLTSTTPPSKKWPTTASGTKEKIIGTNLGARNREGSPVDEMTNITGKERGGNSMLGWVLSCVLLSFRHFNAISGL